MRINRGAVIVASLGVLALVVAALVLGRSPTVSTPVTLGSPSIPLATGSPSPSPRASRVPPDVANSSLAGIARTSGRTDIAICLYVDPGTGLDADAARVSLQSSIDALVRQGYTALAATPVAQCPQAPLFLRTNTAHPKNSSGTTGAVPRVTTPSPIYLWVAVTTPGRITSIFGGLTTRRGAEEVTCTGDNCGEVTGSIYSDPTAFASAGERENLIIEGLGLAGSR